MKLLRKRFVASLIVFTAVCLAEAKTPLIDITDLYHPHQDPGDNFDLIAAYALPEVDLRAVIFDVSAPFRKPVADVPEFHMKDEAGPREPGYIPVEQLNYLFGRAVPCASAPFQCMASPDDKMPDISGFESAGIELILRVLRESSEPVEIVSFGSCRPLAVAFNRDPALLKQKVKRVHICAGASSTEFVEWNVILDRHAFVRVLQSGLPIALYPCATKDGPFALGPNNCYWTLPTLEFIPKMDAGLQRYLVYAFTRSQRIDFLRAMEDGPAEAELKTVAARKHAVWETAVWIEAANRTLVKHADGTYEIAPADTLTATDIRLPNGLQPCTVNVRSDGMFTFAPTTEATNIAIYQRGDPQENERALQQALPRLYEGFRTRK